MPRLLLRNVSREVSVLLYLQPALSASRFAPLLFPRNFSRTGTSRARFSEVRKRAGLKDLSRLLRRVRGEGIGDRRHVTQLSIRRRGERCFRPEAQAGSSSSRRPYPPPFSHLAHHVLARKRREGRGSRALNELLRGGFPRSAAPGCRRLINYLPDNAAPANPVD